MSWSVDDYKARVAALNVFDARCWLGDNAAARLPCESRARSAAELVGLLDRAGLARAVVFHTLAVRAAPAVGNELLLEAIAGHARLTPGVALLPAEADAPALASLIARGARLAAIYPATHGFSLEPWASGEMPAALEAHRLPVVIPHTETSWNTIARICREHPALPVLVEGGRTKLLYDNRIFYPLLQECGNLRLLLDALIGWRMVDDLVARFGPERLIYSSQLPLRDPHVGAGMLVWGKLTADARALIAHGNLEALIAGVRP